MPVEPPLTSALLFWYDRNARTLPWRQPPGKDSRPDPYRVWLAEIMLQQTTVAAAGPYFERFTSRWPTVEALAAADDGELMAAWAGLGYYARARNLLAAAREIVRLGGFPGNAAGLRALPGIGDYTAAAVAAIAFAEPAVVIDANVERVASRLFAVAEPLPAAKTILKQKLAPLVPHKRPGDFAQAMMDLGATICTVRKPACLACPLAAYCAAHALGAPTAFPVKPPKALRPTRYGTAWWMEADGKVALVRRAAKGMLGGMLALPGSEWSLVETVSNPTLAGNWRMIGAPVLHSFTHFDLVLSVMGSVLDAPVPTLASAELLWHPREALGDVGLPTLYKKAVAVALATTANACFGEA